MLELWASVIRYFDAQKSKFKVPSRSLMSREEMGRGWNASLPANCVFCSSTGASEDSMGFQLCGLMRFGAFWRGLIRRGESRGENGKSRKQKSEIRNRNLTALTSESIRACLEYLPCFNYDVRNFMWVMRFYAV